MSDIETRTISLSREQATFIDAQVASGAFASAGEVVWAGLQALQERDAAVERWLRTEVVAAYDEIKAHPERAIDAAAVFDELRAHHAAKLKAGA